MSTEAKAVLLASLAGLLLAGAAGFAIGWRMSRPVETVQDLGGCRR